jgi:hypothetical protein
LQIAPGQILPITPTGTQAGKPVNAPTSDVLTRLQKMKSACQSLPDAAVAFEFVSPPIRVWTTISGAFSYLI